MGAQLPTYTVAVRLSDGICLHWPERPNEKDITKFKRLVVGSMTERWRILVRQVVARGNKSCHVRLIVGFNGDTPLFDEMTCRVPDKLELFGETPSPRKLRG